MSLAKKVAQNTLVQIIGKIVSTILGIFSLALMTRYLGQAGFGDYTTINTFLTFCSDRWLWSNSNHCTND